MNPIREEPYKSLIDKYKKERKIIYLGYGGSRAYGTNTPESDTDIRGIALKTERELLGSHNFDQYVDTATDTTIYATDKFFKLALNCNPNIIELLGAKSEHRFLVEPEMELIFNNSDVFLSKRAINSFGGYATSQLRRLENALSGGLSQPNKEVHIMKTLINMQDHLRTHYESYDDSNFKLYIDETNRDGFETEMFVDFNFKHYPLRDFHCIQNEMNGAIKAYDKVGKRNSKKTEEKLDKHVMHLIRLYLMLLDILEKGEINTFRQNDIKMLMSIRNGEWSANNYEKLYLKLDELEKRVDYAKKHTMLSDKPNFKRAEELLIEVNKHSLMG